MPFSIFNRTTLDSTTSDNTECLPKEEPCRHNAGDTRGLIHGGMDCNGIIQVFQIYDLTHRRQPVGFVAIFHRPVALTMASPPPTGKGPRLNRSSMRKMPNSPRVELRKVAACISPQVHLDISLP